MKTLMGEKVADIAVFAEHKEEVVEEKEKWANHYSSLHQILLVGEGDFSFALCLAHSFGSASNIVASSLDPYDVVTQKYKKAKSNMGHLKKLGALLLHGVDATKMKLHTDLKMRKFDRIIFNFPHAGFHGKEDHEHVIKMHRSLVHGFFKNSSGMLRVDGEIHVNHKTTAPFSFWAIEELASQNSLALIERAPFKMLDFPGYNNKRGAGSRCDESFPLGECSTFKFCFFPTAKRVFKSSRSLASSPCRFQQGSTLGTVLQFQDYPIQMQQQQQYPTFNFQYPRANITLNRNTGTVYGELLSTSGIRAECLRIFGDYLNHIPETFGRIDYAAPYHAREALRLGFERFMAEAPGRPRRDNVILLQELRRLSNLRAAWLRRNFVGSWSPNIINTR